MNSGGATLLNLKHRFAAKMAHLLATFQCAVRDRAVSSSPRAAFFASTLLRRSLMKSFLVRIMLVQSSAGLIRPMISSSTMIMRSNGFPKSSSGLEGRGPELLDRGLVNACRLDI